MPSPVWRRRSLILPYAVPSPSAPSDLLSIAVANNATYLWRANDYSTTTGWSDAIASLNLTAPSSVPAKTTESGTTIVTTTKSPIAYLTVPLTFAEPFEILFLAKLQSSVNNDTLCGFGVAATNLRIFPTTNILQMRSTINASTGITTNTADWLLYYAAFTGVNPAFFKAGNSSLVSLNAGGGVNGSSITIGARVDGTFPTIMSVNAIAFRLGAWTATNVNAIASQMIAEASALSPIWTAIP